MDNHGGSVYYLFCQGCGEYEFGALTVNGCLDHEESVHNGEKQAWVVGRDE